MDFDTPKDTIEQPAPKKPTLIVLFGHPGSGKNFCGELFARFGFTFYDMDTDFTEEQLVALKEERPFTTQMRIPFYKKVHARVTELLETSDKVCVVGAFINDRFRREFLDKFPSATFVMIATPRELRVQRAEQRQGHTGSAAFSIREGDRFEPVTIPALILDNTASEKEVLAQIPPIIAQAQK